MLKNQKLGVKMMAAFGLVAAIALGLGLLGYYGLVQMAQRVDEIGVVRLPSVEHLLVIKENSNEVKSAMRTLLIPGLDKGVQDRQAQTIAAARERINAAWEKFEVLPKLPMRPSSGRSCRLRGTPGWPRTASTWRSWRK